MSKKYYYKVVRRDAASTDPPVQWRSVFADTVYKEGEWTKSRIGGLLVFNSRQAAVGFEVMHPSTELHIFQVEAEERMKLPAYCLSTGGLRKPWIRRLWNLPTKALHALEKRAWSLNRDRMGIFLTVGWLHGTLAFRKVKLLKEIYYSRRPLSRTMVLRSWP